MDIYIQSRPFSHIWARFCHELLTTFDRNNSTAIIPERAIMSENPIGHCHEDNDVSARSNYQPTLIGSYQYPDLPDTWFEVYSHGYPSSTSGPFGDMTVLESCTSTHFRADGIEQQIKSYASVCNQIPESTRMIPDSTRMTDTYGSLPCYATCEYVRHKSCQNFTSEVIRLYNSLDLPMLSSMRVSEEEKAGIYRTLLIIWTALQKAIDGMPGPLPAVGSTEAWITERLLLAIRKSARLIPTMTDGRHALGSSTSQRHLAGLKDFYQEEKAKASTVWNSNQGMYVAS